MLPVCHSPEIGALPPLSGSDLTSVSFSLLVSKHRTPGCPLICRDKDIWYTVSMDISILICVVRDQNVPYCVFYWMKAYF